MHPIRTTEPLPVADLAWKSRFNTFWRHWLISAGAWMRKSPSVVCLLLAITSVSLSCYPVIFFGKSFVSPNNGSGAYLLYGKMPTVPGYKDTTNDDQKGADLGAAMWYMWPTSVVESRALLKHHELPLWNRFDSAGAPLLGQGLSMLGDPLHLLVLFTNGSAGWWDVKYVLAKLLFAFSISLCVLHTTKHLPAAIIMAISSPFIGFFSYRYAHPAFFSLCYAPLILLCWLKFADARRGRATAVWLGAMAVANWMVINSGTVKEAYVLLLAMNSCGLLTLICVTPVAGCKKVKVLQGICVQILFVIIATPIWLTFLALLRNSWTAYDVGGAYQLQPSLIIGLFDDIFYRQFNIDEFHLDPAANFLTLAGVLWFCLSSKRIDNRRFSLVLSVVCILALAMVFGVIPPALIVRVPFLRNIRHIDNTFSCVAIICLLILAGFGIKTFWNDCRQTSDFRRPYLHMMALLALLLALYVGSTQAAQRSSISLFRLGQHVTPSRFFWGYSLSLIVAMVVAPLVAKNAISTNRFRLWHIVALSCVFILLHWRHGMHLKTPFDPYVMNPHHRESLIAKSSPALQLIENRSNEPSRAIGLDHNFLAGYGGAVGIEQIDGPDALVNKRYRALMNAAGLKCYGAWRYIVNAEQLGNNLRLFGMLNVDYVLDSIAARMPLIPSLKAVASLDLNVFECEKVWPRAFFTDRLFSYQQEKEFIALLNSGDGRPFAAVQKDDVSSQPAISNVLSTLRPPVSGQVVRATDYVLTDNTTSFRIEAPGPGVVVLTEAYVPEDFQVIVNGKRQDYFRVNSAFRGILLERGGTYTVSFAYWPKYLTASLWIAATGLVLLIGWLLIISRSVHRNSLSSDREGITES
jgi:heme/copper-type cytochrome/quinol oxidase subunit 4